MPGPQFVEPREETYTQWHNPLDVEQYVDVYDVDPKRPTRFKIRPGETKPIPSRYDNVVHRVYNGAIIGGQAPQLVRVGGTAKLDDALNTELDKKKRAERELATAALQKQTAEENAAIAAAKAGEADKNLRQRGRALPPEHSEKKTDG